MLKKLSIIFGLVLISFAIQSHSKIIQVVPPKAINSESVVDRIEVIDFAKKYLGTKYKYAGADPQTGFDCSGFVHFVFKNFNINLPRGSREYKYLEPAIQPEEFKVGDVLVFYGYKESSRIGHVGIICKADGMKSEFIHSSSGKAYGVTISKLDSKMYTRRFYKCINVID